MKIWNTFLGIGVACAACCAVPVLTGAAVFATSTFALTAFGSALLACTDELAPLTAIALTLVAVTVAVAWLVW